MRPLWVRILLVLGGVLLLAAGVVGWLVPVVTGIPFYIAGIALLGAASSRIRDRINAIERKLSYQKRVRLRRGLKRICGRRFARHLALDECP